jgi:hypothetical protein
MRAFSRWLRRRLNLLSTGLTQMWCGIGAWRNPAALPEDGQAESRPTGPTTKFLVRSPGGWLVPPGRRPGWDWLPEDGGLAMLRGLPWWARIWYRTPFIDRYAYAWMWWHGGWAVTPKAGTPPPPVRVREPRRPKPSPPSASAWQQLPG